MLWVNLNFSMPEIFAADFEPNPIFNQWLSQWRLAILNSYSTRRVHADCITSNSRDEGNVSDFLAGKATRETREI